LKDPDNAANVTPEKEQVAIAYLEAHDDDDLLYLSNKLSAHVCRQRRM
jgi:hypothetical protein